MSEEIEEKDPQEGGEQEEEEVQQLSPEEIKELQEKAARLDEVESALQEKEKELSKLSNKEFNFRKFAKAKKEEQEEMMKGFSEEKKMLVQEVSEMRNELSESRQARMDDAREAFLDEIGADKELAAKLADTVKHFTGEPSNPKELREAYMKAYNFERAQNGGPNPVNRFAPITGSNEQPGRKKKSYVDTPDGKANFNNWFGRHGVKIDDKSK